MKKKISLLLAGMMLMTTLFTGCAKDEPVAQKASENPTTSEDTSFTLRISTTGETDDNIDIAEKMFMEKYPNAKIEYIISPWNETREKQLVLVSMDDIPDIAKTGGWAQEFYKAGILDDMSDHIKDWDIYSKFTEGQKQRMMYGDDTCSLNYNTNTILMFYNKDILEQVGADVPTSFEELEALGAKIKEAGLKNESGNDVFATNVTTHPWEVGAWIWSNDGEFMNSDISETVINSPESIQAHAYAQSFVMNGYAPIPDGTMDQMWLNNQLATYFTGEWSLPATLDAGVNVGVTTVPTGKGGKSVTSTGGCDWAVFKKGENKEKAYEFLEMMYSAQFQVQADRGVTNLEIYDNADKQDNWKESGVLDVKLVQKTQLETTRYQYMDGQYKFPEGRDIYIEALEKLFIQQGDATEILNDAAEKINAGMK